MPETLISIQDAQILAACVPDLINKDGDASIKRRSIAVDIKRVDPSWKVTFTRQEIITLASGKKINRVIGVFTEDIVEDINKTVCLAHPDGRRLVVPIMLAYAIIAQFYVDKELEAKD